MPPDRIAWRYNGTVSAVPPKLKSVPPGHARRTTQRVLTREATGLLIIGMLILALTLARFWHNIHWSVR